MISDKTVESYLKALYRNDSIIALPIQIMS